MAQLHERGERRLLYAVACILLLGTTTLVWMMGRPVYWYLLAEVFQPFRPERLKHEPLPAFLREPDSSALPSEPTSSSTQSKQLKPVESNSITPSPNQSSPAARQPSPELSEEAAETWRSGHGVPRDPKWHQRQPKPGGPLVEEHWVLDNDTMHGIADKDGYIMVTWANHHYFDFVRNWVEHVEEVGIRSYVVGAMDKDILQDLIDHGIPCFAMQSGLTNKDFGWGSKNFHIMGRKKIALVQLFTQMNLTVIISDVDTVWLRNPFTYFKRYPEADILTSSDFLSWTHGDEGLEDWRKAGAAYNIGIMMFSPKSVNFAKEWVNWIEKDADVWDQNAFNTLARRGMRALPADHPGAEKRLFLGDNGRLVVGVLPVSIFASGHTFFVSRIHEQLKLKPYVVHATFQYSGTPGKRNRFREFKLWNDLPSYYEHPVGFLTWKMDIPTEMLVAAKPKRKDIMCCEQQAGHFALANHQLIQFRHAYAIAQVLERSLVIPQFWGGQDRWWAPHDGTLPGAATPLPYRAPIDHFLDLEHGVRNMDERQFGKNVPVKEHSFLENPRCPAEVKNSRLNVVLCPAGSADEQCEDGSAPLTLLSNNTVKIRAGLNDVQIRKAFSDLNQRYKVIEFSSMVGAFSRHASEEDHNKFYQRTLRMASIWCCVKAHPGHVWYDMWSDTVPRIDRHNRRWDDTPFKIITGP